MYIVKDKITLKKLTKMIKEKLEVKVKDEEKLELRVTDGTFYPFDKDCNSYQEVWLSEEESIKIHYRNVDKWWKDSEIAEIRHKESKIKDSLIFQKIGDSDLTDIEIKFKCEHILQAVNMLVFYVDTSISKREDFLVRFNDKKLQIYSTGGYDKLEISIDGLYVTIQEYDFVDTIIKNIRSENVISIITQDWDDFEAISGLHFHYNKNYFSGKEYNRIKNIKTSWVNK